MKPEGTWYQVEAVVTDEKVIMSDRKDVAICARYYDRQGEPAIILMQLPVAAVHPEQLNQMRQVLQANFETPVLLLDTTIRAVKLRPMDEIESRRKEQWFRELKRNEAESARQLSKAMSAATRPEAPSAPGGTPASGTGGRMDGLDGSGPDGAIGATAEAPSTLRPDPAKSDAGDPGSNP